MSVQRRPKTGRPTSGKVRWVVRYRDPAGDEHQKSFATKAEAQAHDQEQARLLRRGEWVDADNAPTLGEFWPTWVSAAEANGTRRNRELIGRNLGTLAKMKITRIRPSQLRQWQADLRDGRPWTDDCEGLEFNTRTNWWAQLSGCLHMAVVDDLLLVNPCTKVPGPKLGSETVNPKTIPTVEQIGAAITRADATGRDTLATMIILAVGTGMRPGEICGLRWRNVDREAKAIRVVEQARLIVKPGQSPWSPPKTESGRRTVAVPPEVMVRLLEHRLRHPSTPAQAMFTTPRTGGMWNSDLFAKSLSSLIGDETWTPHSLRHFFASQMLTSGRSIKAVQKALGHSSAATTIDTYWHILPNEEDLLRSTASEMVRAICGHPSDGGEGIEQVKGHS